MIEFASVVRGVGGYLPEKVLTNDDLAKMVDTTDEWITARTGIKKRHIAADGQTTSDLGAEAARRAMAAAGVGPDDIDLIVVRHRDAGLHLPGDRHRHPAQARHHARRSVRPAGRLLRISSLPSPLPTTSSSADSSSGRW